MLYLYGCNNSALNPSPTIPLRLLYCGKDNRFNLPLFLWGLRNLLSGCCYRDSVQTMQVTGIRKTEMVSKTTKTLINFVKVIGQKCAFVLFSFIDIRLMWLVMNVSFSLYHFFLLCCWLIKKHYIKLICYIYYIIVK